MSRQAPAVWSVVSARRIVIKLQQRCRIVRGERTDSVPGGPMPSMQGGQSNVASTLFCEVQRQKEAGRILAMRSRDGNIDGGAHADNRLKIFSSIDSCRCESSRFKNPRVEE